MAYPEEYAEAVRRYAMDDEAKLLAEHHSTHHGNLSHMECPLCGEETGSSVLQGDARQLADTLTDEEREPSDNLTIRRAALADALRDQGHEHEADFVADPNQHIVIHDGWIKKGKWQHSSLFFAQGDDYDEPARILDEYGPEAAMDYMAGWGDDPELRPYYDGTNQVTAHHTIHVKAGNKHYQILHRPRWGYIGLDHLREVPEDTPAGD